MNFKKITFTVFVLLLSVCCISTPIFADETVELQYIDPSECSHPSNSMVETSQIQGEFYSAISADQHGYYHKIHRRCVLCGYEEIIDRLILDTQETNTIIVISAMHVPMQKIIS